MVEKSTIEKNTVEKRTVEKNSGENTQRMKNTVEKNTMEKNTVEEKEIQFVLQWNQWQCGLSLGLGWPGNRHIGHFQTPALKI